MLHKKIIKLLSLVVMMVLKVNLQKLGMLTSRNGIQKRKRSASGRSRAAKDMPLPLLVSNTLVKHSTGVKCKPKRVKARDESQ